MIQSYQYFIFLENRAEIPRSYALFRPENTIEIGEIIESAFIADFSDIFIGIYQHSRRCPKPHIYNII